MRMTQDRSIPVGASGDVSSVFRGGRFLIAVGSLIAAVGIVAAAISTYAALHAPLDIRGFLNSEKSGLAYGPDYSATWVWVAVAGIGIVTLIVGFVHGSKRRS